MSYDPSSFWPGARTAKAPLKRAKQFHNRQPCYQGEGGTSVISGMDNSDRKYGISIGKMGAFPDSMSGIGTEYAGANGLLRPGKLLGPGSS
jgi:hypothetical protein